jgi:hypothetical protein
VIAGTGGSGREPRLPRLQIGPIRRIAKSEKPEVATVQMHKLPLGVIRTRNLASSCSVFAFHISAKVLKSERVVRVRSVGDVKHLRMAEVSVAWR